MSRRWQNDSMSMDDYSDIAIIDQSPKFQKSHNGVGKQTYPRPSTSVNSTTRSSSQQNALRRPRQHQHQHHRPHHLPQKHSSTLESLVQKPKSFNSRNSAERIQRPESHTTTKSSNRKTTKLKPQNKKSKMNKLKMLNCFASSSNKPRYDDQEALRQQALIAREHYGRTTSNMQSKNMYKPDMGNSPTSAMSTNTMRTEDCFFDTGQSIGSRNSTQLRTNTSRQMQQRRNYHNTQRILEDLHEEETSPSNSSGEDRGGSFINLSISDIEDRFERREAVPLSTVEERRTGELQHQAAIHQHQQAQKAYGSSTYQIMPIPSPPKQQLPPTRSPGTIALEQKSPIQSTMPTLPAIFQQQHHQQQHQFSQQQHIPGKNAPPKVEQKRPEPRPPLTKEQQQYQQLQKQQYYKQRISETTPRKGAGPLPWIQPISSPPIIKPDDHSQSTASNLANERKQATGPRCHFCGGSHWIYNCPHMDESSAASRRRRERRQYYEYDDDETSTDYSSSRDSTVYSRQSDPLQCQPCLKHVTKALKASLQSSNIK